MNDIFHCPLTTDFERISGFVNTEHQKNDFLFFQAANGWTIYISYASIFVTLSIVCKCFVLIHLLELFHIFSDLYLV